jgi:NAD(P)-dependent dehydrogenase (short-subunit alcohol dehydrogenase family)
MMKRFTDKVAVVTGAAQGIGQAIAVRFATEGARVALLDLQPATETAALCAGAGVDTLALAVDVSDKASIIQAVTDIIARWGRLDIWVNNAGIFDDTPLTELSEERWDRVVDVNYKSMFLCAQLAVPHMLACGGGRIINLASMAAKVAFSDEVAYCSSKSAVLGLTRALGVELGPQGITVNAICPGPIETDMLRHTYQALANRHNTTLEDWQAQILETIPVRRYGRPADVAGLAAFLASDDAAFINAQSINIDGGMVFY